MKSTKIVQVPNKILNTKCEDVTEFDSSLNKLVEQLKDALNNSEVPGTGIAANQIGINMNICIVRDFYNTKNENEYKDYILVNPTFKKLSNKQTLDYEGCLSIPNKFGLVKRYKKIKVNAQNQKGEKVSFTAKDYFARVIQHEIDHLNGILFTSKVLGEIKNEKELEELNY